MSDESSYLSVQFPNLTLLRNRGTLKCPDCGDLMIPHSCKNVVVDKCELCEGIWFDRHEFVVFKKTLDAKDLTFIKAIHKPAETDSVHLSVCPRCDEALHDVQYAYKSNVRPKKCSQCSGLWLPLMQTLNLIELTKLTQEIADDVRAVAKEIKTQQLAIDRSARYSDLGRKLTKRIPVWKVLVFRFFPVILPLYDDTSKSVFPVITFFLIVLNLIVFLLANMMNPTWVANFGFVPLDILNFKSFYSLVTSMFTHAGFFHLFFNMAFLWVFGQKTEEELGVKRFLILYFFSAMVASFTYIIFHSDSSTPAIGASAGVSGVLGAYFYLFPHSSVKTLCSFFIVDVPSWLYLAGWFLLQLLFAVIFTNSNLNYVAYSAHLSGFLAGLSLVLVATRKKNFQKIPT